MGIPWDYDHNDEHDNSSNHSYDDDDFPDYHTVCDKQEVRSFAGVFLPVVYTLALILGLAGNSLVIFVYLSRKRLRTMTDVFILNLAFADLLLLLTLPFWAADAVNGWEIGIAACKITSALYTTNFSCGMLLLACISIDRYHALARGSTAVHAPGRNNAHRQRIIVCLLVWALAILLGLPDMVFYTVRQHSGGRNACRAVYPHSMAQAAKATLEILEVSLSFLLPLLVMMFCYCRVAVVLSQAATAGVRGGRRWRAFRVLIAVVGVFLLTQLPYNVFKLVRALDVIFMLVTECEVSKNLDRANQIMESLALTHCCLNPVLYVFIGSSFKMHVLKLAKRCGQTGRDYRHGNEQPTVEISLKSGERSHTHSSSDNEGTSTFTI
ncbi:atypical chemokine receptor 4-like [Myxocyprinus asiaticus]|uniref:atypical chemokine receptor 4-like n=1 Tax=Myxocyprinus asiaticus TaxID=70543 RepID=UPI0022214543|nr:atypical chemokine receptor 4-like [Myxocyprinus asiaticus]XP_051543647.1 atypical chemokine receptor 4-like [Myxocyprinus asiaticus]